MQGIHVEDVLKRDLVNVSRWRLHVAHVLCYYRYSVILLEGSPRVPRFLVCPSPAFCHLGGEYVANHRLQQGRGEPTLSSLPSSFNVQESHCLFQIRKSRSLPCVINSNSCWRLCEMDFCELDFFQAR